ncbi:MAG: NINE protein, partial [Oscillospiraceae bacterium]
RCGAPTDEQAVLCISCSCPLSNGLEDQRKSRLVAGLLGVLLGSLGIHNFYLGITNRGIAQLLLTVVGGPLTCGIAAFASFVWGLVEGIQILTGSVSCDAQGRPLKE